MFERAGIPDAYDRTLFRALWSSVVFREDRFAQAAEHNEQASIERARLRRVGDLTAKDGDRINGGDILLRIGVDGTGSADLAAGQIYIRGDTLPVAATTLTGINFSGERQIGVRLVTDIVTEAEDTALLGQHPGSEGEGEPGAARLIDRIVWAFDTDSQPGEFIPVYLLKNGAPLNQAPPTILSGVQGQIAGYDFDANGHYIVDGCDVVALGLIGSEQVFSIAQGTANIKGFKRIRETALRHAQIEEPDLEAIAAEPQTNSGPSGGQSTFTVSRPPIAAVQAVIVVKQVTENIIRGSTPNTADALGFSSVVQIVSVVQGGTTYVTSTDYTLSADKVSWAPAGVEPAAASTYSVTYRYNASVAPDFVDATTVKATGGVNGTTALISYTSKLPRTDILCFDVSGRPVYLKGLSARRGRLAPLPPSQLLKIAEVSNDWLNLPVITNNGTRNYTYDTQRRLFNRLIDILEQFDRGDMNRSTLEFEPVSKKGIFTDRFVDDFYRDQGEPQTAAINKGVLQLAIDQAMLQLAGTTTLTLDWTEFAAVKQELATSSMKINPYDNFTAMPAGMKLAPSVDFWTELSTSWTSPVTREFTTAPNEPPGQTTINEVTQIRQTAAPTLRQIAVATTLEGFGAGENLATLTLDGVNVKPAGTQTANGLGVISLTFNIPAGMPAGRRLVRATGAAGSFAEAIFVGQGVIDAYTMRRVTLVARAAPDPQVINNTNVTNITNVTQENTLLQQTIVQNVGQGVVRDTTAGIGRGGGRDPLAQSFTLPEPQHVVGLDFKFTAIGNRAKGVRVQLATMINGEPSTEVLAEAFVPMATPVVGEWVSARFAVPVFCSADRQYCFVIMTADSVHAVAICKLGDVISVPGSTNQQRVVSQPYTIGVLFSSANRISWTPHQDADLTMRVVTARFNPVEKTVDLWTGAISTLSDIQVRGAVELPTDAAVFRYEIVRASGAVVKVAPGQNIEFDSFVSETITVRAVLKGSRTISPILWPGTLIVGGRIRTSGTYVTRAFPMGSAVKVEALFAALLPAGSSVAVDVDAVDSSWQALVADGTVVLGNNWNEPRWKKASFTAANGRIRATLTGGPGARPSLARLRAYSV